MKATFNCELVPGFEGVFLFQFEAYLRYRIFYLLQLFWDGFSGALV